MTIDPLDAKTKSAAAANEDAGASAALNVAPVLPIADLAGRGNDVRGTPDGIRLAGSRCSACGATAFPERAVCCACGGRSLDTMLLPKTGTLYSFTTVWISAARAVPYSIGYVDLPGNVRLLANLRGAVGRLRMDAPVFLAEDADGWHFRPSDDT